MFKITNSKSPLDFNSDEPEREVSITAKVNNIQSWEAISFIARGIQVEDKTDNSWYVTARIKFSKIKDLEENPFISNIKISDIVHPLS